MRLKLQPSNSKMVRRKLISSSVAIRNLVKATQPRLPAQPVTLSLAAATAQTPSTPFQRVQSGFTPNLKYIDERVNNVFNIILAEINHKNAFPALTSPHHSNSAIYKDPYNFKDRILQELVANSDINQNYNIHDLIEEEFQLEISDQEFQQFKSLKDIVKYVKERFEIRQSMFPYDSGHSNSNATY